MSDNSAAGLVLFAAICGIVATAIVAVFASPGAAVIVAACQVAVCALTYMEGRL